MSLDVPSSGAAVQGQFAVSGWALDLGADAGTGVDTVHVWAQSVASGEWGFLGAASMGVSRPDVGAAYGASFPAQDSACWQRCRPAPTTSTSSRIASISGTFNNVQTKRITVVAPPSRPAMFIDLPVPNQNVTQNGVIVAGWALDLAASSGAGVDAIHVWAYPLAGGAPDFRRRNNRWWRAGRCRWRLWLAVCCLWVLFARLLAARRVQPCSFCPEHGRQSV